MAACDDGGETKRTGGESRGEFVISGPRIFELPSHNPRGELHPYTITALVHFPFMCACANECVCVCVYTLYIIYIPSSPGPSGNSSLYDLVWPGRVSESPAATAQPRHGCTRRTVEFFLFLVARPVHTTSIRRPPQGFLEDPLYPTRHHSHPRRQSWCKWWWKRAGILHIHSIPLELFGSLVFRPYSLQPLSLRSFLFSNRTLTSLHIHTYIYLYILFLDFLSLLYFHPSLLPGFFSFSFVVFSFNYSVFFLS